MKILFIKNILLVYCKPQLKILSEKPSLSSHFVLPNKPKSCNSLNTFIINADLALKSFSEVASFRPSALIRHSHMADKDKLP